MSRPAPPPRHQAPSYWPRHRFAWQLHSKLISVFSKLLHSPASWWPKVLKPKVHRADTIICWSTPCPGGLSQISVDRVDNYGRSVSPVIREAELVSCPSHANKSRHLPDYPQGDTSWQLHCWWHGPHYRDVWGPVHVAWRPPPGVWRGKLDLVSWPVPLLVTQVHTNITSHANVVAVLRWWRW